jgi:hypothetical protein
MRKFWVLLVALLFATSMIVVAGCSKKEEAPKPAAEAVKAPEAEKKAEEAKPAEAAKPGEAAKPAETPAPEKK